jgi:hypothetical protein
LAPRKALSISPTYTRNAGNQKIYWQGPSIGFDAGADGDRTMMLVYNLPETGAIFDRFGGINGSAYFIGGFGMTALTANNIVVVPIRSGIGLRLGANLGHGWVCSKMRASRNTTSSAWRRAMTCIPIGSPSLESPAGNETAGFQHRLASMVNGVAIAPFSTSRPPMVVGGGPPAANAGTAVVGHSSTSTSSKMRAQSSTSCCRRCIARAYFGSG